MTVEALDAFGADAIHWCFALGSPVNDSILKLMIHTLLANCELRMSLQWIHSGGQLQQLRAKKRSKRKGAGVPSELHSVGKWN